MSLNYYENFSRQWDARMNAGSSLRPDARSNFATISGKTEPETPISPISLENEKGELDKDNILSLLTAAGTFASKMVGSKSPVAQMRADRASLSDTQNTGVGIGTSIGVSSLEALRQCYKSYNNLKKNSKGSELVSNPYLTLHGLCEENEVGDTVSRYLRRREYKKLGGKIFSAAGGAASVKTAGINSGKLGLRASSTATSSMHSSKLSKMAAELKSEADNRYVYDLIKQVENVKLKKALRHAGDLAVTAIPGVSVVSNAISLGGGIAKTIGDFLIPSPDDFTSACLGAQLHWLAVLEQAGCSQRDPDAMPSSDDIIKLLKQDWRQNMRVLRNGGPATMAIESLFKRRGIGRLGGQYSVGAILAEPSGWLAIADKIKLS